MSDFTLREHDRNILGYDGLSPDARQTSVRISAEGVQLDTPEFWQRVNVGVQKVRAAVPQGARVLDLPRIHATQTWFTSEGIRITAQYCPPFWPNREAEIILQADLLWEPADAMAMSG